MPYFDNSIQCFPKNQSSTKTYQSYMCPSKQEYLINKCTGTENCTQDKHLRENISKLRQILSETISNLARENNLKKGESVELTLEIDLMKSFENTPTNSLVEVTIIQHVNTRESNDKLKKLPNKMVFMTENVNPSMDKTSPPKLQVQFKGKNSNTKSNLNKEMRSEVDRYESNDCRKHIHKPLSCVTANQRFHKLNNIGNHDARSKFIRILPEETTYTENFSEGYQKVSQRKKRQEPIDATNTVQEFSKKVCKKSSLMKKISEIFVPPKKLSKNEVVKSALTALKNEIDYIKTPMDEKEKLKHNGKRDTTVHHLGKLINNILFDVMASMDDDSKTKVKDDLSLPLEYHRFFETVSKTSKKPKEKKVLKRKSSPSIQKLYRSHSDTCCVSPLKIDTEPKLKTSNSISDCQAYKVTEQQTQAEYVGDTKQTYKKRKHSRSRKQNLKGNNRTVTNTMVEDDNKRNFPYQRAPLSRTSLIQWNGRNIKVRRDIKARIEMLIVNELENLALKEGMECDVTPLSSTDNTSKDSTTVEKISSFMCELDISDKNVRKMMKKKKSLHNKVSVHRSPANIKMDHLNPKPKGRTCTTIISSGTQPVEYLDKQTKKINKNNNKLNHTKTIKNEENSHHKENKERNSTLANISDIEKNSVEVKYMNENVQNWSAESQTITLYSPEVNISHKNTVYEYVDRDKTRYKNNKFVSTGFVKIIKSDDSTWNGCYTRSSIARCIRDIPTENVTAPCLNSTGETISTTGKSSSKTSNELDCCIEIELDLQDLKYILQEAKNTCNADKVLIEAKCVRPVKKHKFLKLTGKNTPSYTNQLLTNAAKKLEKYTNTKSRNKKSK